MPRTIVITGASSGLGRAAAIVYAKQGHRIALAARRSPDLEETARLCREAGGEAMTMVTDVTDRAQVERLAQAAITHFGPIDVWINNAGITMFGVFEQTPFEGHKRVIETNLFGAMAGAHAILPHFRARGRGVLINVGSVLSEVGQPFVPAYVISKFGLRGLTEALRAELADDPDVHVCSFLPYAIDTPHFQSGANYVGKRARAMPPVQSPEVIALELVALSEHPRREVMVPRIAKLGLAIRWAFPVMTERLIRRALARWHFDATPQAATEGNLYRPVEIAEGAVHGDRRPQIGFPGFALWAIGELGRMALQSIGRGLRSLLPKRAALPARTAWSRS